MPCLKQVGGALSKAGGWCPGRCSSCWNVHLGFGFVATVLSGRMFRDDGNVPHLCRLVAAEHLRCGSYDRGTKFLILF